MEEITSNAQGITKKGSFSTDIAIVEKGRIVPHAVSQKEPQKAMSAFLVVPPRSVSDVSSKTTATKNRRGRRKS